MSTGETAFFFADKNIGDKYMPVDVPDYGAWFSHCVTLNNGNFVLYWENQYVSTKTDEHDYFMITLDQTGKVLYDDKYIIRTEAAHFDYLLGCINYDILNQPQECDNFIGIGYSGYATLYRQDENLSVIKQTMNLINEPIGVDIYMVNAVSLSNGLYCLIYKRINSQNDAPTLMALIDSTGDDLLQLNINGNSNDSYEVITTYEFDDFNTLSIEEMRDVSFSNNVYVSIAYYDMVKETVNLIVLEVIRISEELAQVNQIGDITEVYQAKNKDIIMNINVQSIDNNILVGWGLNIDGIIVEKYYQYQGRVITPNTTTIMP